MTKKLVTTDEKLISKVENVLKEKGVKCAKIILHAKLNKALKNDEFMLVVINKHGEIMREAIENAKTDSKYFFGVLRGHPKYTVPKNILIDLSKPEVHNG